MTTVVPSMLPSSESASSGGTLCWMSPELLDPARFGSNGRLTYESDCYALGMVIYEVNQLHLPRWSLSLIYPSLVLTGLRPFYRLSFFVAAIRVVLGGLRPEKPVDAESLGFSEFLWGLVQSCWSESSSARPTSQQLLDYLSPASLNWVPPTVYPVEVTDDISTADPDSLPVTDSESDSSTS